MNRQEYLDKRNALYDKAKQLIAENKLAEAREVTQQIDKLDSEFENSAVNMANKNAEEGIKMPPAPFENHKSNIDLTDEGEQVTDMYATLEYRKAFANYIQNGVPVPQKFMNVASQTTSSTAAAIVPTTMYQRLIVELEKIGEIYARVFKTAYPTALLIPTQNIRPTASWVDEEKGSDQQQVTTDKVVFAGYKLECKVAFSLFMTKTALDTLNHSLSTRLRTQLLRLVKWQSLRVRVQVRQPAFFLALPLKARQLKLQKPASLHIQHILTLLRRLFLLHTMTLYG